MRFWPWRLERNLPLIRRFWSFDQCCLLWVEGRLNLSNQEFMIWNLIILPGKEKFTRLLIEKEHLRLLYADPTLMVASLTQRFHIMGSHKIIHAVIHGCVTCKRVAGQPHPQLLGQLPRDRLNPRMVFDKVGVDCTGPKWSKVVLFTGQWSWNPTCAFSSCSLFGKYNFFDINSECTTN